jgi:hypothetical protein
MTGAAPRSSDALRAELAALDLDLERLDGLLASGAVQLRYHALSARRGDPEAVKAVAACEATKRSILSEIELAGAAKVALNAELQAALDREAAQARKAMSDEALAFAQMVEPIGAKLDQALAAFKEAYADLKGRLHRAEERGYGPGGAVVQSALT